MGLKALKSRLYKNNHNIATYPLLTPYLPLLTPTYPLFQKKVCPDFWAFLEKSKKEVPEFLAGFKKGSEKFGEKKWSEYIGV